MAEPDRGVLRVTVTWPVKQGNEIIVMDATNLETQPTPALASQEAAGAPEPKVAEPPLLLSQKAAGAENLSEDAKIAAQALSLTEEPAGEKPAEADVSGLMKEKTSLLNEVTALRALRRELGQDVQAFRQSVEQARPPEKSPLEKYTAENPDDPVPSKVMLAERDWQQKQSEIQARQSKATSASSKLERDIASATGRFSLFDDVITGAQDLITEGDRLDFKNALERGEDSAKLIYERCLYKTLMAGGSKAKVLRDRLKGVVNPQVANSAASVQKTKENKGGSETTGNIPPAPPESFKYVVDNPVAAQIYSVLGYEP